MNGISDHSHGTKLSAKEYNAVDVFKFICCILVIAIHTKPFVSHFWLDAAVGLLTRFAVPYFFAASSFFLFLKLHQAASSQRNKIFLQYLYRLLTLYGFWYVIHNLFRMLRGSTFSFEYYIMQFIIPTNGSPLWFLAALIFASTLVFLLSRWFKQTYIFYVSILFLLIGYCFSTLDVALSGTFLHSNIRDNMIAVIGTQNGLFFGFPYVALGALMVRQERGSAIPQDLLYAMLCFGSLGVESLLAVQVLNAKLTYLWLSALPMTYFVMRYTLGTELRDKNVYYYLRKMSTLIYVLHPPLVFYVKGFIDVANLSAVDSNNLLLFVGTAMISILIGFIIIQLSEKRPFKFLKYIY